MMRTLTAAVVLLLACGAARAELTCEQLALVAQTTLTLRNQGASLSQVLADVERSNLKEKYAPDEINIIRQTIRLVYTSEISREDLIQGCLQSGGPKGGR